MKLKLKKGLKLNIAGALPEKASVTPVDVHVCAITPDDFPGLLPKLAVKEGDKVTVGTPVLYSKSNPDLKLVSPIEGSVKAIVRGDRRKIMRVEIEAGDSGIDSPVFPKPSNEVSARSFLAESGLLAFMRQRPYDIIPNPSDTVRDIFVTAFDAAPLALDSTRTASLFTKEEYESAIKVLSLVTKGKIYISYNNGFPHTSLKGAEMVEVSGPYPSSNVGVQIANIVPVDKGDIVWTLDITTLGRIGRLAQSGKLDFTTLVAIVGPEVKTPSLVETVCCAAIAPIIDGRVKEDGYHHRIISGNVFTGTAVNADGYLHFPYRQITVIAEGDDQDEFMGWASFAPSKMSQSRTFPGHFLSRAFSPDARLNGGRRAMIMSGEYERTMPMDILPEYLIKAIVSNNIEDMEKLGIYEVAPEDFAAAEYVDTSKLPLQQIVRDGLDYIRKELE